MQFFLVYLDVSMQSVMTPSCFRCAEYCPSDFSFHFMFKFRKVLFNRYCNMKTLQLYFNLSGKLLLSPFVLELLQHNKNKMLITDILGLEGLSVRLTGRL